MALSVLVAIGDGPRGRKRGVFALPKLISFRRRQGANLGDAGRRSTTKHPVQARKQAGSIQHDGERMPAAMPRKQHRADNGTDGIHELKRWVQKAGNGCAHTAARAVAKEKERVDRSHAGAGRGIQGDGPAQRGTMAVPPGRCPKRTRLGTAWDGARTYVAGEVRRAKR